MSDLLSIIPVSRTAIAALAVLALAGPAVASECGSLNPPYSAERTITVKGTRVALRVFISGSHVREERLVGSRKLVTIRNLDDQSAILLDDEAKTATRMQSPPPPPKRPETRVLEESGPGGTKVRKTEFQSNGQWLELSRTTCRPDGIMLSQKFTSLDEHGQPIAGLVNQSGIVAGPVQASLFDVPPDYAAR